MKTYIIEDENYNIIEYTKTLKVAKSILKRFNGKRIIMMEGKYFGEGFHKHHLYFMNGKYIRCKV